MPSNTRSVWQKKVTLCWSSSCFWKDFNIKVKNIHSRLWSVCSFESEPFIIWRGRNWRGVQVLTTGLRWELELVLNCKWTWDKWSDTCSARVWRRRCKVRCSGLRGVQVFYLTQQGSEGICYGGGGVSLSTRCSQSSCSADSKQWLPLGEEDEEEEMLQLIRWGSSQALWRQLMGETRQTEHTPREAQVKTAPIPTTSPPFLLHQILRHVRCVFLYNSFSGKFGVFN